MEPNIKHLYNQGVNTNFWLGQTVYFKVFGETRFLARQISLEPNNSGCTRVLI